MYIFHALVQEKLERKVIFTCDFPGKPDSLVEGRLVLPLMALLYLVQASGASF